MTEGHRTPCARRPASVAALVLLVGLVAVPSAWADPVGVPGGAPYLDEAACIVPWLADGGAATIEGVTVRAVTNTSDYLGAGPEEGLYLHEAVLDGASTRSTTRLTFDPAVEALEFGISELVPIPPNASESYRFVGSPGSGADVLDWTLTDTDVVASGTFTPGIATLDIDYDPSISPDGASYGAYVRLRIPRVGETCDVEDAPPPRDRDTDDADDEALPVPLAVPSGRGPSGGADAPPDRVAATVGGVLAALALLGAGAGGGRRVGRRGA